MRTLPHQAPAGKKILRSEDSGFNDLGGVDPAFVGVESQTTNGDLSPISVDDQRRPAGVKSGCGSGTNDIGDMNNNAMIAGDEMSPITARHRAEKADTVGLNGSVEGDIIFSLTAFQNNHTENSIYKLTELVPH